MKKIYDPKTKVENLYSYLKKTDADEIVIRTTRVAGCWYDAEFAAHAAGFECYRILDPQMVERHEFADCYRLIRK